MAGKHLTLIVGIALVCYASSIVLFRYNCIEGLKRSCS